MTNQLLTAWWSQRLALLLFWLSQLLRPWMPSHPAPPSKSTWQTSSSITCNVPSPSCLRCSHSVSVSSCSASSHGYRVLSFHSLALASFLNLQFEFKNQWNDVITMLQEVTNKALTVQLVWWTLRLKNIRDKYAQFVCFLYLISRTCPIGLRGNVLRL